MDNEEEFKFDSIPIPNINKSMSKKKQARKLINYLIGIVKPAKTRKGRVKQGHNALAKFKKYFPDLVKYL